MLRQNPENLKKIQNYIHKQSPNINNLAKSFQNARTHKQAQAWIDLKIPQSDLEDIAKNMDLTNDPNSWTKAHKAKRWNNYLASDEPKLGFNEWSNTYDGGIDKVSNATESVNAYKVKHNLEGFVPEQYEHVVGVSVNVRGKMVSGRRHDLYNQDIREAIEIKDYRSQKVYLSEDIEREVRMDLEMLKQGILEKMTWVFLEEGPSGPLRELLDTVLPNGKRIIIEPKEL